jgi:L-ascorbate metabolism protein UlaG (beta-lactamase superfamily)
VDDSQTDVGPLRITWFGHSTVLVELDGARLLTDPFLRGRIGHVRRVAERVKLDAARELDAVLISHAHHDHLDLRTLRRLGRSVRLVVPTGTRRMLARRGYSNVTELRAGDETSVGAVVIGATHAEHHVKRYPFGEDAVALGYVISGSARVYFAGDTDLFDDMREIGPNVDVALIPVSGWGPRLPPGHLNPESAATAVSLLHPKVAVPIHWGTYRRLGLERDESLLRAPAETFAELAHQLAPDVDIRLLPVGGTLELRRAGRDAAVSGRANGGGPRS